jgi:hypothetical protein
MMFVALALAVFVAVSVALWSRRRHPLPPLSAPGKAEHDKLFEPRRPKVTPHTTEELEELFHRAFSEPTLPI